MWVPPSKNTSSLFVICLLGAEDVAVELADTCCIDSQIIRGWVSYAIFKMKRSLPDSA